MAENSPNILNRFNSLSRLPAARQLGLLLGLAASIALGMGLVQWAMEADYAPLYGDLSPGASSEIVRTLESRGIAYKIDNRSGLVSVPADRVHEVRLQLASEGLPEKDGSGYDMLYKEQEMGVSSFMEKARFDRALERELSNSIATIDSVRSARVHLALPKQSAFVRKKSKPAASVLLSLYGGRGLSERQLAGVVHMVAFSVPGLEAEQVSVLDNHGRLLSSQSGDDDFAGTKEQFRFARQLEQSYVERITEILTPIVGVGSVSAQVTADMDFSIVEKTSETYQPQTSVRSEQLVEEITDAKAAGGIPGTLSNQPPENATLSADLTPDALDQQALTPPSRSSKREVRNYELDKTISHIKESPGSLNKLSVAVVVDYIDGVDGTERQPLSDARMAEITSLVKEAVGFNEERGDRVNVVNASFISAPALEPMPEPSLMEQEWIWRGAKILLGGIAVILVIFTVLKPLMQASSAPPPAAQQLSAPGAQPGMAAGGMENYAMQQQPMMAGMDGMQMPGGEDQVTLSGQQHPGLPGGAPGYQQQLSMARSMVDGEPERVAHVVKNWVSNDG